ncbi:pyruvate formate-lyase-activating protein [Gordoniibacillus kamchatkensis]|uniref:pyruvate formate-lyase-activating protein n=1 Tax=Gordoniibacillus kamchatkensis TaxID=1590651 RepID=UPI00069912FF|nr:pyruvate formate-lyase-activating protein [Paenibacillus sp. VKM B-2647]
MKGRIHSIETFGTVDGPGIRFVLFMQGCALQCQYCHNPDTWDRTGGRSADVEEILSEVEPYLDYYRRSGGGITVTGGEPMLQAPFLTELFLACKRRWNLHTALDSSGFCDPAHAEKLLDVTDLVLLDLKQMDRAKHIALTGHPNDTIIRFARRLSERSIPVWIRHVLVPGLTDSYVDLKALGEFIGELDNVEKVELLPYHNMGAYKWRQLGKTYALERVPVPSEQEMERARHIVDMRRLAGGRMERPAAGETRR